jgi:hypothetical protein
MWGHRRYHPYTFVTDRFGFRNDGVLGAPLDVIVLGDSFGVGTGTTQDKTWSALLSREHGLAVYNLSVSDMGPWAEYTNLTIEIDRLKVKDHGTVVIWNLYTGNDLQDPCYPVFDKRELPWRGGVFTDFKDRVRDFRGRSPLGLSLDRFHASRGGGIDTNRRKRPC